MAEELPSKTKRKQAMTELQDLGAALIDMPLARLKAMHLPEPLRLAVLEARRISSREARRRQLQYIGRLMREVDPEPIRAVLDEVAGRSRAAAVRHRQLERWRARLIEDDEALTEFVRQHPSTDLQALRAAIRNARKEIPLDKPPRAQRELFRLIRDAVQNAKDPV